MEIILLERVHKLGKMGDKVGVKAGYARNYLVPQGMALPATKANLVVFEARRAELESLEAERKAKSEERKAGLHEVSVTIVVRAGEEGKLFGSVGVMDIVEHLAKAGHTIEKSELRLPEGPIRAIGEHAFDIDLGNDVIATIKVIVEAEETEH